MSGTSVSLSGSGKSNYNVSTGSASSLPSLWVFLLIVLAVLLALIALTSLSMHLIQRRRRQSLRRRITSGEVDLEALGIKRLTIPQELLDKMPIYTYGTGTAPRSVEEEKLASDLPALHTFDTSPLSQPTCPICLEDFELASAEHEGSNVRELPCHHIFHPECVDSFLRINSSLCPMCKKSALPRGYCPKLVTSAMVRRERNVRRIRANLGRSSTPVRGMEDHRVSQGFPQRVRSIPIFGRRLRNARPITESQRMEEIDLRAAAPVTTPRSPSNPDVSPTASPARARSTLGQREWARQRAMAMLGRSQPMDPDVEESQQTPAWRKAVRSIFPGFGQ